MIPDFQTIMRPLLAELEDGQVHAVRDLRARLAITFHLSEAELVEKLPSGRSPVFTNRVGWATTHLSQAGLLAREGRGLYRLTQAGRQVLERHPDRVDMRVLDEFQAYRAFRERTREQEPQPTLATTSRQTPPTSETPEELLANAISINRAAVEGDVLQAALGLSPTGFEDLVIQLLSRMGYGRAGSVERTSATGDAGVDGIISQDPLGLDRIYVQAKRYAEERTVDRPRIHEFAGALLGKQGDRGVFITASSFSSGAIHEAERINARIELIDGKRLAQLLVQYGVGVQEQQTAVLYRLDEDYFEGL